MAVPARISLAHDRAAERLIDARGSVRAAFDSLDAGLTFDDLIAYVDENLAAILLAVADEPERFHGRLVGLVAGAALTIVESDRERQVFLSENAICGENGGGGNRTRVSFQADPPALQGDSDGELV